MFLRHSAPILGPRVVAYPNSLKPAEEILKLLRPGLCKILQAKFRELRKGEVQLWRTPLSGTWMNKPLVERRTGEAKFYSLACGGGGVCSCSTTGLCSCSTISSLTCSRP